VFGHCLYACGHIFIDRSNRESSIRSIQTGIERLPEGVGVMFFAEGTRSANGRLGRFKKGGFSAALQTGLPILPVTINGSARVLSKKSIVFSSFPIEVVVSDPIEVGSHTHEQIDELMEKTREAIDSNLIL
jgi:1-acyl-sn-glycerol-3-phosphate acyltransferase